MVEISPARSDQYALNFAGDTLNTAWYLRQLADDTLDVAYLSAIGADEISEQMRGFITDAGIYPELETISDRSVGLYLISLKNGERSFQYWRSVSAARKLADNLSAVARLKTGDMAYFSGITLAILSVDDRQKLLGALADARKKGVTIVLDSNLRPKLWPSPEEMCYWVMKAAVLRISRYLPLMTKRNILVTIASRKPWNAIVRRVLTLWW